MIKVWHKLLRKPLLAENQAETVGSQAYHGLAIIPKEEEIMQ